MRAHLHDMSAGRPSWSYCHPLIFCYDLLNRGHMTQFGSEVRHICADRFSFQIRFQKTQNRFLLACDKHWKSKVNIFSPKKRKKNSRSRQQKVVTVDGSRFAKPFFPLEYFFFLSLSLSANSNPKSPYQRPPQKKWREWKIEFQVVPANRTPDDFWLRGPPR